MRIRDGDPIKLISHDLGFGRQADFAREFKLWYGVSPDAFRQNFQSQIDRIRDAGGMRS
jgi:AraC-like DNA-binding protein